MLKSAQMHFKDAVTVMRKTFANGSSVVKRLNLCVISLKLYSIRLVIKYHLSGNASALPHVQEPLTCTTRVYLLSCCFAWCRPCVYLWQTDAEDFQQAFDPVCVEDALMPERRGSCLGIYWLLGIEGASLVDPSCESGPECLYLCYIPSF